MGTKQEQEKQLRSDLKRKQQELDELVLRNVAPERLRGTAGAAGRRGLGNQGRPCIAPPAVEKLTSAQGS